MKIKERKKIVCFIFCLAIIIFLGVIFKQKDAILLHLNWKVSIPSGYTIIYQKQTEAGFIGDGIRYHVFQYKGFHKIKNIENWKDEMEQGEERQVKELLKKYKIKEKYWPDFSVSINYSLFQKDGSKLYMFFDSAKNCIYVLEDIM